MIASHSRWILVIVGLGLGFAVNCGAQAQGGPALERQDGLDTPVQAQGPVNSRPQKWEVRLAAGDADSELSPRFTPVGTRLALTPASSADLPGSNHLEGQLRLGAGIRKGSGQRFALARSQKGGCYDLLLIDFDQDGSLADEKPLSCQPSQNRGQWWSSFQSTVKVEHNVDGAVLWQDYPLSFWVVVQGPDEMPSILRFTRKGFLTGPVHLGDTDYDVVLSDGNNDGLFGTGDFWTIQPLDATPSTDRRRVGDFAWVKGQAYKLELADSTGTKGWLVPHDPGITQAQDEEARDLYREDRTAPRAASPLAFRRDVEQAIADAKAGKTPYFLDFETTWCGPCRQMDELVYTAQAVVDAARGILCIKVDGDERKYLVALHRVGGYPTGILFGPDGREMTRFSGYHSVKQMTAFLQTGRRPSDDIRAFVLRLEPLRREKSWKALEEEAAAWIAGHPEQAQEARLLLGTRLESTPDPQAKSIAERLLREVLATDPNSAQALNSLAGIVGNSSRFDEAIQLYRRLLAVDPVNTRALNDLAWILSEEKGQYDEALALAARAVARNSNDPHAVDTYGVVCFHLQRLDEAQKHLQEAVRLMPPASQGATITRYHLAQVYEATGRITEAADLFQRSLNLHQGLGGLTSQQTSHAGEFLRQHPAAAIAQASPSATATDRQDRPGAPSSRPATASGDKLLQGTWAWDLDRGDDRDRAAVDLWWEHVNEKERYLVPRNGAQLAVVKGKAFAEVTRDDLQRADFAGDRISASDAEPTIDVGTILAVRTTEGNLAKVEVVGFDPLRGRDARSYAKYHMRLRYVVYRTGSSRPADQAAVRRGQTGTVPNADQPAHAGPSVPVHDAKLYSCLQAGLAQLVESDRATKTEVLRAQLQRDRYPLALPDAPTRRIPLAELYENCRNSVLVVSHLYHCSQCGGQHPSIGGGFAITASGVIVTSYHVVDRPDSLAMGAMTAEGKMYAVKEVLAADKKSDIALLQLDGSGFTPLPIATGVPVGASIAVIGHPAHRFYTLTTGIVSRHFAVDQNGREVAWIAATADTGLGASGAPLLNESGAVVGVASQTQLIQPARPEDHQPAVQMTVGWFAPAEAILRLLRPGTDH